MDSRDNLSHTHFFLVPSGFNFWTFLALSLWLFFLPDSTIDKRLDLPES